MKPKLRFKEFSDEYVLSDLGKYLIQYKKTTNSNNQYPVLTSSRSGIFFQEDYFNRQVASKDNTGYNIVPRNYFTYRHMSDDTIFSFNINTLCDYGIVSTLYPVFTTNTEMNSNYLKEYLNNSKRFSEYCLLQKQGGSRTYMYFDKLKKFVGCFPSIQEQTKVSNFLSLIDKKIDLQSKKIEDLKLFTKKLLKIIINSHNCIERTVDSVAEIYLGLTYTPQYVEKGVPFLSVKDISSGTINNSDIKYISQEEYDSCTSNSKPKKGDILFGRVGTLGCPIIINDNIDRCIFVSLGFLRLKTNDLSAEIIKYWMLSDDFKNQINKKIAGSSQKNLNTGWLKKFVIRYPKDIKEQEKYLKVANTLDKKLKLEMVYLEKLIKQKKGFMQNMFV